MGAATLIRTYKGLTRKQVETRVQQDKRQDEMEDGCSYSGSWGVKSGINFVNRTFKSSDDAYEYIEENNDKWGPIDVCYFEEKLGTEAQNKRIETQKIKAKKSRQDLNDFYSNTLNKIRNVQSKTKGCKSCCSRFPISTLGSLNCPNCRKPLLTDTEVKKVSKINENIKKEKIKLSTLISKKGGKTLTGWVVGGWCSC